MSWLFWVGMALGLLPLAVLFPAMIACGGLPELVKYAVSCGFRDMKRSRIEED